jgi:2-C-methyl-D-erythritol 4-phosphate cytidylyltransferase
VVAAAPVTDTIKQVARGVEVDRTLDRSSLWAAQTPQAFRADVLREALASTTLLAQATDDAMLVERIGGRVLLHRAPAENIKVTTPLDLRVAELLLAER